MMTPARFKELAEEVRREHGIDHELPSIAHMIGALMTDGFLAEEHRDEWMKSTFTNMDALPEDQLERHAVAWHRPPGQHDW